MTSKVKFIKVNFHEFLDCVWRKVERIYKTVTKCNRRNEIFQTFVWWRHKFAPTIQTSLKLGDFAYLYSSLVANKSLSNLTFLVYSVFNTRVASIHANLWEQKEILYVRKEYNSHRICLKHQYGRRDVMQILSPAFTDFHDHWPPQYCVFRGIFVECELFMCQCDRSDFLTVNFVQTFSSTCCAFRMNDD